MKIKFFIGITIVIPAMVTVATLGRIQITAYPPRNADVAALKSLFVAPITARNNGEVERFLATRHAGCRYMVAKGRMAAKEALRGRRPRFWMPNDDDTAAFAKCMARECWNANEDGTGMRINPHLQITGDRAFTRFQFHAGLFLDANFFHLTVRTTGGDCHVHRTHALKANDGCLRPTAGRRCDHARKPAGKEMHAA